MTSPGIVKRGVRFAGIVLLAVGLSFAVLLGISFSAAGYDWTMETLAVFSPSSMSARFGRSQLARRWRCWNVQRPLLTSTSAWTLQYSWTGGYGSGDIHLKIQSDGRASYLWEEHGAEPEEAEFEVPAEALSSLASLVDETGLLCLEPRKRADHQIVDLGTYRISVIIDEQSIEVFAGQCYYLDDPDAFYSVRSQIYALEEFAGRSLSAGPYGHATIPEPCDDGTS